MYHFSPHGWRKAPPLPHGPERKWVVEQTHYKGLYFLQEGRAFPVLKTQGWQIEKELQSGSQGSESICEHGYECTLKGDSACMNI